MVKEVLEKKVPVTLHWDGKLLRNTNNNGSEGRLVDRLVVLIKFGDKTFILGIPKLNSGKQFFFLYFGFHGATKSNKNLMSVSNFTRNSL